MLFHSALSLFDARAVAIVSTQDQQEDLDKIAPGVHVNMEPLDRINFMIKQHMLTLESMFPKAFQKLRDNKSLDDLRALMLKSVFNKQNENNEAAEVSGDEKYDDEVDEEEYMEDDEEEDNKEEYIEDDSEDDDDDEYMEDEDKSRKSVKAVKKKTLGCYRILRERNLAVSIWLDQNDKIENIKSDGRPTSPFSGTMGAHTTAFIVYKDLIWESLVGKTLADAAATLLDRIHEAREHLDAAMRIFPAESKQLQYIDYTLGQLSVSEDNLRRFYTIEDQNDDTEVADWDRIIALQDGSA